MEVLTRLLRRLHSVFQKTPEAVSAVAIEATEPTATATVSDCVLYLRPGVAEENVAIPLEDHSLAEVVASVNAVSGFTASPTGSIGTSFLARAFLDRPEESLLADGAMRYPTALLWTEMQVYAWALEEQASRVDLAADQVHFLRAADSWLDRWGRDYFGIPRYQGETDTEYRARAIYEIVRPIANNRALEILIEEALGIEANVIDALTYIERDPVEDLRYGIGWLYGTPGLLYGSIPDTSELPTDLHGYFLVELLIDEESMSPEQVAELTQRALALATRYKAAGTRLIEYSRPITPPEPDPLLRWRFEPGAFLQDEASLAPPLTNFGGVANPGGVYTETFVGDNGTELSDHTSDSGHVYKGGPGLYLQDGGITGGGDYQVLGIQSFSTSFAGLVWAIIRLTAPGTLIFNFRRQDANGLGYKLSFDGTYLGLYRMTPGDVLVVRQSYTPADGDNITWTVNDTNGAYRVAVNGGTFLQGEEVSPPTENHNLFLSLLGFSGSGLTYLYSAPVRTLGGSCAYFEPFTDSSGRVLYLTDADLPSGFPFKGGESNQEMTITFFYRQDIIYGTTIVLGKGDGSSGSGSWDFFNNGWFGISKTNSSNQVEYVTNTNEVPLAHRWYHVAITLSGLTGDYKMRVWDSITQTYWSDFVGTFPTPGVANRGVFGLGGLMNDNLTWSYSGFGDGKAGWLDEVHVFDSILTNEQIDATR